MVVTDWFPKLMGILFVFDDDDLSLPFRVEEQMNTYVRYSNMYPFRPVLVYGNRIKVYDNGEEVDLKGSWIDRRLYGWGRDNKITDNR